MINKVGAFTSFGGDLKSVIVGNMVAPTYFDAMPDTQNKKVLQQIVSDTKEDLDNLASTYASYGVEVHRPKITHSQPCIVDACGTKIINPMPNFQPHDHVLCIDNTFINSFVDIERYFDQQSIKHIVDDLDANVDYVKIDAPNIWDNEYYDNLMMDMTDYPGDKDTILHGPAFYPCGQHIFYTEKYCISPKALDFVKDKFSDHSFISLELPFKSHLDAQIRIIHPGVLLTIFDPDMLIAQIPQFSTWTILHDKSWYEAKEHKRQTYTELSNWIDDDTVDSSVHLGVVNIRPDLVAILKESKDLCDTLQKANIDWVVCPLRHAQFWNFSLSCATAIIHREDHCEDYLN